VAILVAWCVLSLGRCCRSLLGHDLGSRIGLALSALALVDNQGLEMHVSVRGSGLRIGLEIVSFGSERPRPVSEPHQQGAGPGLHTFAMGSEADRAQWERFGYTSSVAMQQGTPHEIESLNPGPGPGMIDFEALCEGGRSDGGCTF
jgi:hypothetical protein